MLHVVATPLGNLEDLSPRAVRILSEADWIACEDTRHTRKLLSHFGIRTPTTSYHEHNEAEKAPWLVEKLKGGERGALVSDAGTPLVSDPGYRLVRLCRQQGVSVLPVPGPSAGLAALSVSGLPCDSYCFAGFGPRRAAAQREWLKSWSDSTSTLVFYLSPHILKAALKRIQESLGDRPAFLAREMTKLHETHYWGRLSELLQQVEGQKPRGEYTLVVEGIAPGKGKASATRLDAAAYVEGLMKRYKLKRREAAARAARELGLSGREAYKQSLEPR
ncbi:MAG: 16S rRNA (cytidine(1402)-2'-O)-methyltransferase [Acidobacteriota bacterium]